MVVAIVHYFPLSPLGDVRATLPEDLSLCGISKNSTKVVHAHPGDEKCIVCLMLLREQGILPTHCVHEPFPGTVNVTTVREFALLSKRVPSVKVA